MIWDDIKYFMTSGRKWSEIKEAQQLFESKEDLDTFFKSGWSIQDVKEAKEMVETSPVAQKTEVKQIETQIQQAQSVGEQVMNQTGLEIPENHGMVTAPKGFESSAFKKLAERN